MDPNLSAWLNRVGLLLDLVSFWLVAPEFIGEERLRDMEERVEGHILNAASWPESTAYRILEYLAIALVPVLLVVLVLILVGVDKILGIPGLREIVTFVLLVGVAIITPLFIAFRARGRLLVLRPSIRLLKLLRGEDRLRHLLFWCGAILFALGVVLQVVGTF